MHLEATGGHDVLLFGSDAAVDSSTASTISDFAANSIGEASIGQHLYCVT